LSGWIKSIGDGRKRFGFSGEGSWLSRFGPFSQFGECLGINFFSKRDFEEPSPQFITRTFRSITRQTIPLQRETLFTKVRPPMSGRDFSEGLDLRFNSICDVP
jgi:hypothetical protein